MNRRTFVTTTAMVSLGALLGATQQTARTRLILLGTGGGPRPKKRGSAPAQVIVFGGAAYVVDCGDGVARQLTLAGVPPETVRHVFLTHHHSDHNADYGNLLLLAWITGLRSRVDTWGPPPLARIAPSRSFSSAICCALRLSVPSSSRAMTMFWRPRACGASAE